MVGSLLLLATPMIAPAPKVWPPRPWLPPKAVVAPLALFAPSPVPGLFPKLLPVGLAEFVLDAEFCPEELSDVEPPPTVCWPEPEEDWFCEKIPFWFTAGCVFALP